MIRSQISFVDRVWLKLMLFEKAGEVYPGHSHKFSHVTILAVGSLKVSSPNKETRSYKGPCLILIPKDTDHKLEAQEDGTVAICTHALRNGEGMDDIVDSSIFPDDMPLEDLFTQISPLIHMPVKPTTE